MRLLVWIFCIMTLLLIESVASLPHLSEKLIVYYSKDEGNAEEELLKLKVYFIENEATRSLQEKYNLDLDIEHLADYHMVVIKPIVSLDLRNELRIILTPLFKDIFFLSYQEHTPMIMVHPNKSQLSDSIKDNKKEKSFMDTIGLQWLVLLLLSVVGLLLSIASRRNIIHLGNKQQDLKRKQTDIEIEIKKLGSKNA